MKPAASVAANKNFIPVPTQQPVGRNTANNLIAQISTTQSFETQQKPDINQKEKQIISDVVMQSDGEDISSNENDDEEDTRNATEEGTCCEVDDNQTSL